MKKVNLLAVGFAFCLVAAASLGASAQNAPKPRAISLKVTFEPNMSDGTPCAVCGDGLGEYVDGVDGVTAYFSRIGNLQSYFGGGTSTRGVSVSYTEFYPSPLHPDPVPPPPSGLHSYGELISSNAFEPYTNLQDMRVDDAPQCLKAGWTLDQGRTLWENNYHRNGSHFFDPLTSYLIASCVEEASGQCTKWEIEPAASDCNSGTIPTLANVVKKMTQRPNLVTYQDYGLWKLPFRLTLTRN